MVHQRKVNFACEHVHDSIVLKNNNMNLNKTHEKLRIFYEIHKTQMRDSK